MRKVGMAIGAFILLMIVGVVVFAATFNVNQYRGRIQTELEKRLNRKVSLGDMHLGLFPPRFQVQNLSIADDPKFNAANSFVEAQELDVSVKLLPLLHKSMEISSVSLQRPRVELVKDAQGTWNFSTFRTYAEVRSFSRQAAILAWRVGGTRWGGGHYRSAGRKPRRCTITSISP